MIYVKLDIKDILGNYKFFIENSVGIEISMYDVNYTNKITFSEVDKISRIIRENNIKVVTHLPMYSLDMGTKDMTISNYSRDVILRALDISSVFGAEKTVFHLGYNPLHPQKVHRIWFKNFVKQYRIINEYANSLGLTIVMENVWEKNFYPFDFMKDEFSDIKFCFDIGHAQVYLSEVDHEEFIKRYKNEITHIHMHDNMLIEDIHLHIGEGKIDFDKYFNLFYKYLEDFTVTLETTFDTEMLADIDKLKKRLIQ